METNENANLDSGNPNVGDVMQDVYARIDEIVAAEPGLPDDVAETPAQGAAQVAQPDPTVAGAPATTAPAEVATATSAAGAASADTATAEPKTRADERLASREAQIAEKEKALREREKELSTLGSKLRRGDFASVLTALGVEEREVPKVVRAMMASQLPEDKRPPQYKQYAEELQNEDRIRSMISEVATKAERAEQELARYKEQVAQQQAAAEYHADVERYLSTAETEVPTFTKLLKADRNEALKRLYNVVQADAQAKLNNGGGVPLTPAEAAKAVEAELTRIATLLGAPTTSTPQPKTPAQGRPSLSTKAVVPSRTPSAQNNDVPVEKQIDNWLKQNGLI